MTTAMAMKTSLENITLRYFYYFANYSNSSNLCSVAEVSGNYVDRNGVHVRKMNEKFTVVCSRPPQILEFDHFVLLFC